MSTITPTIAQHLINRLKERGVRHVFGVPGDYVLDFMDRVIENGLDLVGNCNELNAGYAADGYARARGLGACVVTYGVGGFSILNAVAGACAEQVPLVVISGAPHARQKYAGALVHHLAGDYNLQFDIFKKITAAASVLDNPDTAASEIDRVLAIGASRCKPVYLEIPVNAVDLPCRNGGPDAPPGSAAASDPGALAEAADEAAKMLNTAQNPVIIAGIELLRFQLGADALDLAERAEIPYATTISSKSVLPELHPQFIGVYQGVLSRRAVREQVEASDCALCLGVWMNDFNTGFFTTKLDESRLIQAHADRLQIKHHSYRNVHMADFIRALSPLLAQRSFVQSHPRNRTMPGRDFQPEKGRKITVRRIFERLNAMLDDDKIIISDTGDAICAAGDLYIEEASNFIAQAYYLSIGYSLPATLGVALASPGKRVIDVIGDGAFQMTGQELSTIVRRKLNPVIFVLNNGGYVIERMIHDGPYNDIQNWQYYSLPEIFGGQGLGFRVQTEDELEHAIGAAETGKDKCVLVEVVLGPTDCSDILAELGRKVRGMSK